MITWWNELLLIQQIFALIAIPSTFLIVLQTVLMLIGIGGDNAADADGDLEVDDIEVPDDGLAIFTVRGVTSMLCITGWVAVALLETSLPQGVSIAIAILCGIATLIGMAYLMRAVYRRAEISTLKTASARSVRYIFPSLRRETVRVRSILPFRKSSANFPLSLQEEIRSRPAHS